MRPRAFGFRISRRESGALSMMAAAAKVSGMFTLRRRRLFRAPGERNDASDQRLPPRAHS